MTCGIVAVHVGDGLAIGLHEAVEHVLALGEGVGVGDHDADGLAAHQRGVGGAGDDAVLPSSISLRPNGGEAQPTSTWSVITAVSVEEGLPVAIGFTFSLYSSMKARTIELVDDPRGGIGDGVLVGEIGRVS